MIIAIGTTNRIKVEAVEETVKSYPQLAQAKLISISVPSEVAEQPLSLEETIRGAKNRARNAFQSTHPCNYSFGIESGLFKAEGTLTGFLEACICCIYDGSTYHTGMSCGFEIPPPILSHVLDNNRDLSQACFESGITLNPKLGASEGLIGILTNGRINRKLYTKQAIMTALIKIENEALFQEPSSSFLRHSIPSSLTLPKT